MVHSVAAWTSVAVQMNTCLHISCTWTNKRTVLQAEQVRGKQVHLGTACGWVLFDVVCSVQSIYSRAQGQAAAHEVITLLQAGRAAEQQSVVAIATPICTPPGAKHVNGRPPQQSSMRMLRLQHV